jgi:hypothetical protein
MPDELTLADGDLSFAGGVNSGTDPMHLVDGEVADALNFDFDRGGAAYSRGSIPFNNQKLPRCGIRTRGWDGVSRLSVGPLKSVPVRGYGYIPFDAQSDIGGDGDASGTTPWSGSAPYYHATSRRGRSFDMQISFRVPEDQALFSEAVASAGAVTPSAGDELGVDEALLTHASIVQKGGDRTAPMNWCLGITNFGTKFSELTGADAKQRKTGYHLTFTWLDAPEWGVEEPVEMEYSLTTSANIVTQNAGASNTSVGAATLAFRTIVFDRPLEPGRNYHVALQLVLDSGDCAYVGSAHQALWNGDGILALRLIEDDHGELETYGYDDSSGTSVGAHILHGPRTGNDTLKYLCRYGVRYTSRDATFLGLGHRFAPILEGGSLPFGVTSAPLENGGYQLTEYADQTQALLGLATPLPTLTFGTGSPGEIEFNLTDMQTGASGLSSGSAYSFSPFAVPGTSGPSYWKGIQPNATVEFNWGALSGYLVTWMDGTIDGLRAQIGDVLSGGTNVTTFETLATLDASHDGVGSVGIVYPFRWSQIDLELSDFRIYSTPRDFTDPRVVEGLRTGWDARDVLDPARGTLIGCWPLDDGEGGALRSGIGGPTGYLAPFSLAQDQEGDRGSRRLFLSGEGEALTLDLSTNPVVRRELQRMLEDDEQGFAIELTCVLPEQSNAVASYLSGNQYEGALAPILASWEVNDPDAGELAVRPKPLLRLTQRGLTDVASSRAGWRKPAGFTVEYPVGSDQEDQGRGRVGGQWDGTNFIWDSAASWVGEPVTFQFGVEANGSGSYDIYLAVYPRQHFTAATAAQRDTEYAFFATATMTARDLVRSRITIGGGWDTAAYGDSLGYCDLNARMIVDEVRVYGAPVAGALPGSSPGSPATAGKIQDRRRLEDTDIRRTVGPNTRSASVVEGSATVTQRAWQQAPEASRDAALRCFFGVSADRAEVRADETLPTFVQQFYRVGAVSSDSFQLETPYAGPTQGDAAAFVFRLLGYAELSDDLGGDGLSLGGGSIFVAGTTLASEAIETGALFANRAPVDERWAIRLLSPLGTSLARVAAGWCMAPRRPWKNRGLGLKGVNDRLLALTRGMLYEADDRWRRSGPSATLPWSLAFRGGKLAGGARRPLRGDWLDLAVPTALPPTPPAATTARVISALYRPEAVDGDASLLWLGDTAADQTLAKSASGLAGAFDWALVVERGYPVLRVSSEQAGATATPVRGVYRARGQRRLRPGERVRLTVLIPYTQTRTWWGTPRMFLGGQEIPVEVNEVGTGAAAGDWLQLSGIEVAPTGEAPRLLVGASREPRTIDASDSAFTADQISPDERVPETLLGVNESAHGELSQVLVWNDSGSFDPSTWNPDATATGLPATGVDSYWTLLLQEGVGHITIASNNGSSTKVAIRAHPGIPLLAGTGDRDQLYSMATYQGRMFGANGGKVVVEDGGVARFAGVPRPSTKPTFTLERKPLWVPNQTADASTATDNAAASAENGPVVGAQAGADEEVNHYSSNGNNYLYQPHHPLMDWEADEAWCTKFYVRVRETSGTIDLWTSRQGKDSGRFIQCVNGKLRFGWYDTALKEQVGWETSSEVFVPGYVHYVALRKQWPQDDSTDGNWQTQFPVVDASNWKDSVVVRRFAKVAGEEDPTNPASTLFYAKCDSATFNCVSFTPNDGPTGTTATGLVTPESGVTYSCTSSADTVTASTGVFHPDMVGMLFQFAETDTTLYRVSVFTSSTSIDVVNAGSGAAVSFPSSVSAKAGGVFIGAKLVPFGRVNESREPDGAPYDFYCMGSPLQANPLNGITPFNGEMWSMGWVSATTENPYFDPTTTSTPTGSTVTDNCENGFDVFEDSIYTTTPPGALFYTAGGENFTVIQSSQANTDLQVTQSDEANLNARPLAWTAIESTTLLFQSRRIAVTFYDPTTNQESDPSPTLVVQPSGEDLENFSGAVRTRLANLPVDPTGRGLWRRIYISLAGQSVLFRVATIEDDTSSSYTIAASESRIAAGAVLERRRSRPPRCSVVAASGGYMAYGGLVGQEDGIVFSQPFAPEQVPLTSLFVLDTGDGTAVTAMHDLNGRLIAFKRNAVWRIVFQGNVAREQLLDAGGSGCVGPQAVAALSGRLYFLSDQGPYILTGATRPQWLGRKFQRTYRDEIDPSWLREASATVNRGRQQVQWAYRDRRESETTRRLGLTFDDSVPGSSRERFQRGHVASPYQGPDCSVLGEVEQRPGGQRVPVGITEDGYVVWLDREDTQLDMRGDTTSVWGDLTFGLSAVAGSDYATFTSGTPDLLLDGLAGRMVGYAPSGGGSREVKIAFVDQATSRIYFKEPPTAPPVGGTNVAVGRQAHRLLSRVFAMQSPHQEKQLKDVRFVLTPSSSAGNVTMRVYTDLSETAATTETVDIATIVSVEHVQSIRARVFQFELESDAPKTGNFARVQSLIVTTFPSDKR